MRSYLPRAWILCATACATSPLPPRTTQPKFEVVQVSDVSWEPLNPARGDQSPRAGTLWGDRNGTEATGYLLRPVDGFRSPPHIHNVSYRAVVIQGRIHNDSPDAEDQWMTKGAYWTQPKGAAHITAARGTNTLAYVEIDEGPYLVWPINQAFESSEKARNTDASDIAWASSPAEEGIEMAPLWGDPTNGPHGSFFRVPSGFRGTLQNKGPSFRGVLVVGSLRVGKKVLAPGSYFYTSGPATQPIECDSTKACVVYVRVDGSFEVKT